MDISLLITSVHAFSQFLREKCHWNTSVEKTQAIASRFLRSSFWLDKKTFWGHMLLLTNYSTILLRNICVCLCDADSELKSLNKFYLNVISIAVIHKKLKKEKKKMYIMWCCSVGVFSGKGFGSNFPFFLISETIFDWSRHFEKKKSSSN